MFREEKAFKIVEPHILFLCDIYLIVEKNLVIITNFFKIQGIKIFWLLVGGP